MNGKKAFTLVELIITIAVVAILAAGLFIATKPQKRIGETNDAKRKNDAQALEQAIKVLAADTGVMPELFKNLAENQAFAIVKAGGDVEGTYSCTALGTSLDKKDISAALLSVIPQMPTDPDLTSSSNETGYYIVRRGSSYDVEPCNTYRLAATSGDKQMCGDGYCGSSESCSACAQDCGTCPAPEQQSYTVGPTYPVTGANGGAPGTPWETPENIVSDNAVYATYPAPGVAFSYYDDSAVLIKANGSYSSEDKAGSTLWANGVLSYGDSATLWGETWTPADINDSDFGFAIVLEATDWNYTYNTQYLKASNFGFTIPETATITGIKVEVDRVLTVSRGTSTAKIDYIRITVYYDN